MSANFGTSFVKACPNYPGLPKNIAKLYQHTIALAAKLELPDSLSSNNERGAQFAMGAEQVSKLCHKKEAILLTRNRDMPTSPASLFCKAETFHNTTEYGTHFAPRLCS